MLQAARVSHSSSARCCYSTCNRFVPARSIQYGEVKGKEGFDKDMPVLFTKSFSQMPAIEKWFRKNEKERASWELNLGYLEQYGGSLVPLEFTQSAPQTSTFERFEAPLSFLLAHMSGTHSLNARLYLAQHSLNDLPDALRSDLPTPLLLSELGRGDIYASSLWMGRPPTRTPLHRDPNPNLFIQLAGQKIVRLMPPDVGRSVYERVRMEVGKATGKANLRDDGMMQGQELKFLEDAVWSESVAVDGVEARLDSGDGLYIPLGWWHAVHGTGQGANASANWWFR